MSSPSENPIHEIRFPSVRYRQLPKSAKSELERISAKGFNREHATTYDAARCEETSFTTGRKGAVLCGIEIPDDAKKGQISLFHNHPDEMPPSSSDVAAFLASDKIGASTVITPKGIIYELTKTKRTAVNPNPKDVFETEKKIYDRFYDKRLAWMIFAPDEDILRGSLEELAKKYHFKIRQARWRNTRTTFSNKWRSWDTAPKKTSLSESD